MLSYLRGREARPASAAWNLFKCLSQTVVFWSVFFFLLPAGVLAAEHGLGLADLQFGCPASRWCGATLFILGASLGLTSTFVMATRGRGTPIPADCPRELVVAGPYRFVRNPMAVAGLSQGVAVGLFVGSPAVIAYALAGGPIWNLWVRPWEEVDLEQRFGEPYRRYCEAVRCWWPRFPGYRLPLASGAESGTTPDRDRQ